MTKLIVAIALVFTTTIANAQLRGSGNTITKSFEYNNFDKVFLEDINGKTEVLIGKSWSILITIDDNLMPLLGIEYNPADMNLKILFKGNQNNKLYVENTNVKIKITMPTASLISNKGNSQLVVKNVTGSYFKLENVGNGDVKLEGTTNFLEIEKTGNGEVFAETISTKKAYVKSTGNGDTLVNVSEELTAVLSGNGDIINTGKAAFSCNSKKSGNGDLVVR
jgi:hypothetical protein